MLTRIAIASFIIFENVTLEFASGMTVITGITGSGKSVLFDAIEFTFGNKLKRKIGSKPACVELTFKLGAETFIVKHEKTTSSKFYINDAPSTKAQVQALQAKLLVYQRQNQHLQSLDNKFQRQIIDQYANQKLQIEQINQLYYDWQEANIECKKIKQQIAAIDLELNAHFLSELAALKPDFDDWQELNATLVAARSGEKNNACYSKSIDKINNAIRELEQLINLNDNAGDNLKTCLNQALIAAQEAELELSGLANQAVMSPAELEQLELRAQEYFRLARKHKSTPENLVDIQADYQAEVDRVAELEHSQYQLEQKISTTAANWLQYAESINQARHDACVAISPIIEQKLNALNMTAKIALKFSLNDNLPALDAGGELEFLIATKPKQPLAPVAKVVSGGEAARLSLVLGEILSGTDKVYLMDEVDVGVSGAVASAIGQLLARMANKNQVICITHTPQVAGIAEHHISMSEQAKVLSKTERVHEIAAMLCHAGLTDAAIQQAEELLA